MWNCFVVRKRCPHPFLFNHSTPRLDHYIRIYLELHHLVGKHQERRAEASSSSHFSFEPGASLPTNHEQEGYDQRTRAYDGCHLHREFPRLLFWLLRCHHTGRNFVSKRKFAGKRFAPRVALVGRHRESLSGAIFNNISTGTLAPSTKFDCKTWVWNCVEPVSMLDVWNTITLIFADNSSRVIH